MSGSGQPVRSLGCFIDRVAECREEWRVPRHKELWFRGEDHDYADLSLRPELYRPARHGAPLQPIPDLLSIEYDLHSEFKRNAGVRLHEKTSRDDWNWESWFLMQHHNGPTRLLDWSDGALMAVHFALHTGEDAGDACIFVLDPRRLAARIRGLPETHTAQRNWQTHAARHPDLRAGSWEDSYLPASLETMTKRSVPEPPMVLDFPLITQRIAAQRSRFLVFGTDPGWLVEELHRPDSSIRAITIAAAARSRVRQELRDCGVTESVIFPDLDGLGREMRQLWQERRLASAEP